MTPAKQSTEIVTDVLFSALVFCASRDISFSVCMAAARKRHQRELREQALKVEVPA